MTCSIGSGDCGSLPPDYPITSFHFKLESDGIPVWVIPIFFSLKFSAFISKQNSMSCFRWTYSNLFSSAEGRSLVIWIAGREVLKPGQIPFPVYMPALQGEWSKVSPARFSFVFYCLISFLQGYPEFPVQGCRSNIDPERTGSIIRIYPDVFRISGTLLELKYNL